jgi:hypothetical protein
VHCSSKELPLGKFATDLTNIHVEITAHNVRAHGLLQPAQDSSEVVQSFGLVPGSAVKGHHGDDAKNRMGDFNRHDSGLVEHSARVLGLNVLGPHKPNSGRKSTFFGLDAKRETSSESISTGMGASIVGGGLVTESVLLEGHNFVAKLVFNDGLVARLPRGDVSGAQNQGRSLSEVTPIAQEDALVECVAPVRPVTQASDMPIHKFVHPEMVPSGVCASSVVLRSLKASRPDPLAFGVPVHKFVFGPFDFDVPIHKFVHREFVAEHKFVFGICGFAVPVH